MKEQVKTRWRYDAEGNYYEEENKTGKLLFDDEDKISIVSEYVTSGRPAQEIIAKYHLSSRNVLFSWMDKYVNGGKSYLCTVRIHGE